MIDDRDLAERLSRLAAAVPVRPGQLDLVHAGAVAARLQLRMRWLTPLVALVVLVLIAGVVGIGPLNILNGPISATTRQGDFELTLRSAKAEYMRGEPIAMSATLMYVGQQPSVQISHASSPMTFGIVEPVRGLLLNGSWLQSCGGTELVRGAGVEKPFTKSFGSPTELAPDALAFVREPRLVLPPGTWHPYVVAEFGLGDCGSPTITMRTEIEIDVLDGATWIDLPSATAGPSPTPIPGEVSIHMVNLDPTSVEILFRNKVVASLACGESEVISGWELESAPLWNFIIRNGEGKTLDAVLLDGHLPAGILFRNGEALTGPWPMSYGPAADACSPDVASSPSPTPAPEPTTEQRQAIDLDTASSPAGGCDLPLNIGTLVLDIQTGLGIVLNGEHHPVRWPQGYTGWREGDEVVLRDSAGVLVARVGQSVGFGGFSYEGETLVPCTEVRGIVPLPGSN